MPSFSALARHTLSVVLESGSIMREHFEKPHTIKHKGRIDLVTETDLAIEHFLKNKLHELAPEAAFLAEESASGLELPDSCWIIDPVDGTTNFAHGLPLTVTSVALRQHGELVLGIINAPLLGEWYLAEKDCGACRNGTPIHVSMAASPEEALVATGFPYTISECSERIVQRLQPVLAACQGVRRCGAAALDLAWTACGRFDAYYEEDLKPWDVAAGVLLLTEAGGKITDMEGRPHTLRSSLLATNGRLHDTLLDLLNPAPDMH